MSCIRKFFIREFYGREVFFSSDNFVVWNWFSRPIVNIIHTTVVTALRSLSNRFMFMIFVLCNIFFFFFLQFGQKSSTCLTIMCSSSHRQCAVKTLNTRLSCKNLLNSILPVLNWIMSALCAFGRPTCMFKWRRLTLGVSLRYWISFVSSFHLLSQIFRDEARMRLTRVVISWWRRSDDNKAKLCALSAILLIISLLSMSAWSEIQWSFRWASWLRILSVVIYILCSLLWSNIDNMTWIIFSDVWLSK